MSELVHEGKKYEAKDIPGFGLSFVPVKEEDIWEKLGKNLNSGNFKKHKFKQDSFIMRLVYDVNTKQWNFIIVDHCDSSFQIRCGFNWSTRETLMKLAKGAGVIYVGEEFKE